MSQKIININKYIAECTTEHTLVAYSYYRNIIVLGKRVYALNKTMLLFHKHIFCMFDFNANNGKMRRRIGKHMLVLWSIECGS